MFLLLYASKYGNSSVKYVTGAAIYWNKLIYFMQVQSDAGKQ